MKKAGLVLSGSVIIVACSAKILAPTDQQLSVMQQKVPGITLEAAKAGYTLYSEKCAGCHHLYQPEKYTIVQWDNILSKMFLKAKITGEDEQRLIRDYVHALSK